MLDAMIKTEYERWCEMAAADADLKPELEAMEEAAIEDAFYRELEFGTAGLRGVIGAGTNRMNVYTVAKASQGLANYVKNHYPEAERSIAVSRDSRIKGDVFVKVAAGVFADNGIKVWVYPEIMPTPCLSFAVRDMKCAAGIMVTASHNPAKYNGYKVYNADGCQITNEAADEILAEIEKLDVMDCIKDHDMLAAYNAGVAAGLINDTPAEVTTRFVENVKAQSVLAADDEIDKNVSVVYTPLNGSGLKPVIRTLTECGYTNINVVKEQEAPDGNFPTCPYPNPEIREAMQLGIETAQKCDADILIATDPDSDRCGIAVKNAEGEFVLISGNEAGILMLDYLCSRRVANGTMPADPFMVKTIVSSDLAAQVAESYGVKVEDVLTGFKYIGETIKAYEDKGQESSYVFGFEESYGYLAGTYVRDKDAVVASMVICEMFAYYKTRGISLLDKLDEIYKKFGYRLNITYSFTFEGSAGFKVMQDIMASFRTLDGEVAGQPIEKSIDYAEGVNGLPKANVIKFVIPCGSVIMRPSGTEPKLKAYISVSAPTMEEAKAKEAEIAKNVADYIKANS